MVARRHQRDGDKVCESSRLGDGTGGGRGDEEDKRSGRGG